MEHNWIMQNELSQVEHIRALEMEELQVEEADDNSQDSSPIDAREVGGGSASPYNNITFNTCLASLHRYLGEVEDTRGRVAFLDGGAILNLPMFYLEGVVLFPEATLPLRVVQPSFRASIEKAMNEPNAPFVIGVVRVYSHLDRLCLSTVGTTAEILQYKRLEDGSLNVITRGRQRFYLRHMWTDSDGVACAEVQIIMEDIPSRTPKDAFAQLASIGSSCQKTDYGNLISHNAFLIEQDKHRRGVEFDSGHLSDTTIGSDHSDTDARVRGSFLDDHDECVSSGESTSTSDEAVSVIRHRKSHLRDGSRQANAHPVKAPSSSKVPIRCWAIDEAKWLHRASMAFWPRWVYRMFDAYSLAQRAADMWKQIIGGVNIENLINKPDIMSFYIGSRIPVSESTRQELLEIAGISYRLQREIQLLQRFDMIRCKSCQAVIARRSDMVVMSNDGPMNAYANPHGYVHEVMTLSNAAGLALRGPPVKEHSWFPGYAWTITNCATCESNMGWLFTATKRYLRPRAFWGIRSSRVADEAL